MSDIFFMYSHSPKFREFFFLPVQEFPGQKLHIVEACNGDSPTAVALCGRHNHASGAWQKPLFISRRQICRNCLRVKRARRKKNKEKLLRMNHEHIQHA